MTELDVLKEVYEETMDKVFRASGNYLMTRPKVGFENDFYHETEKAEIIDGMIKRMEGRK